MTHLFSIFFLCESENSPDTYHHRHTTLDDETVSKAVRIDLGLLGGHGCHVVDVARVDRDGNNRCHRCKKLMQIRNSLPFSMVCAIILIVFILSADREARSVSIPFDVFDDFPGRSHELPSRGPRPRKHNCRCIDAVNLSLANERSHNVH